MAINQQDFITPIEGNIVILNNGARLVLVTNADANFGFEGNENFRLTLRKGSNTGPIVSRTDLLVVRDTSNTITYNSLVESADTVAEGDTISFVLSTTNLGPNTTLYYNTVGNVTSSLFTSGNTGSFLTTGDTYTLDLITTSTVPDNETRFFQLEIREGSPSGEVKITSNVITVVDALQAFVTATGGFVTLEEGWKTHIFTSSNSFTVSGLGIPTNRTVQFEVIGGGGAGGRARTSNPPAGTGGGAGGYLQTNVTLTAANTISIIIGGGGGDTVAPQYMGTSGTNTLVYGIDLNLNAVGGGGGGGYGSDGSGTARGLPGGSGGGSGGDVPQLGGAGVSGQGNPGGDAGWTYAPTGSAAGGGGAGEPGFPGAGFGAYVIGARGGNGISSGFVTGIPTSYGTPSFTKGGGGRWFAGGGAASVWGEPYRRGIGGIGGGGAYDTPGGPAVPVAGARGVVNTGGGGNGTGFPDTASGGGSGIVMLRYPYTVKTFNLTDDRPNIMLENSNITYSLSTINVSNNTSLYYTTSGNVTTSDFVGGNTGSFTVVSANATFELSIANNIVNTEETKTFELQIRENSLTGPVVATSDRITIVSQFSNIFLSSRIVATGGTVISDGGYNIHVFTSSGNLAISSASLNPEYNTIEYLVVAGGGGGGGGEPYYGGGGGGAGGLLLGNITATQNTYTVEVGSGGAGAPGQAPFTFAGQGNNGANSSIKIGASSIVTALGGGGGFGGAGFDASNNPVGDGGSGGGNSGAFSPVDLFPGRPPQGLGTPGQGNPGGFHVFSPTGSNARGGGGGGAGQPGAPTPTNPGNPANGGNGLAIPWVPASYGTSGPTPGRWFAGGGAGAGATPGSGGAGGGGGDATNDSIGTGVIYSGGGGRGNRATNPPPVTPVASGNGEAGGSGIVIVRYRN